MPITLPAGSFNTGRDIDIVWQGPYGDIELKNVEGWHANQQTANINVMPLKGAKLNAELPQGWSGTLSMTRSDNGFDAMFAAIEAGWLQNGDYKTSTVYEYITEADGSESVYRYDGVAAKLADAGDWRPDAATKISITWAATQRVDTKV